MLFYLLVSLPLLGSLIVLGTITDSNYGVTKAKRLALGYSSLTFLLCILIWVGSLKGSLDSISFYFILLTGFTVPVCLLASWDRPSSGTKPYLISFLVIEAMLFIVFGVSDLLIFYTFFEAVLIPIFFVIGLWGASQARIRASILFFLYTLFGSLFILYGFIILFYLSGSKFIPNLASISYLNSGYIWCAIFLGFAIKLPLIPFHSWLISAHVEAPISGSMVLAGLMLKLAVYGFLRVLIPLFPEETSFFRPLVLMLGILAIIYASISALRQTDFKCLIAYTSIAHIGVVLLGLFSNSLEGLEGAFLLSLAHGFVSPAIFYVSGGVLYNLYHSRVILYYKGALNFIPLLALFFFLFTLGNIGTPITINWISEFLSLIGLFKAFPFVALLASSSIVLSASYSIWLYNRLMFGSKSPFINTTRDLNRLEFHVLFSLLIPTYLFGLFPNLILKDLHYDFAILLIN